MSVTSFTLVILLAYLAVLKVVSMLASRRSRSTSDDYFLASREVGTFAIVATLMASTFSTATVVGHGAKFFVQGSGYMWMLYFGLFSVPIFFVGLKFWKLGRERNYITPGAMLGDFYESSAVRKIAACIGLIALIPYSTAQLIAIGKTLEALTSGTISYNIGVGIITLSIGMYLFFGGSRAVIWTDAIQGILIATLLVLSTVFIFHWAGGYRAVMDNFVQNHNEIVTFSQSFSYYEMGFLLPMTFLFLPYMWQRMYMAKSPESIAVSAATLPVLCVGLFILTYFIGASGHVFFPEGLADSDKLIGEIFSLHSPYLGAIFMVAAFSAGMSTVDSQLLSAASLIQCDLFGSEKGGSREGKNFAQARNITVMVLVAVFALALTLQSVSIISLVLLAIEVNIVFIPSVLGLFFFRFVNKQASIVSLLSGTTVLLLYRFTSFFQNFPMRLEGLTWAFLVSMGSFLVISYASPISLNEQQRRFRALKAAEDCSRSIQYEEAA